MVNGPGLFSDIGKRAKDLLTKDYISDQKFTISTCSDTGVIMEKQKAKTRENKDDARSKHASHSKMIVLETMHHAVDILGGQFSIVHENGRQFNGTSLCYALTSTAVKKGGLSTGDVGAVYKYKNTVIDVKVDTESNISTTFTVTDVVPSTKTIASLKVPDCSSGKYSILEVQYFHHHATFTTALSSLSKSPIVDVTATLGTPTIAFGVEAGYDTTSGAFTKYTAGVGVSSQNHVLQLFCKLSSRYLNQIFITFEVMRCGLTLGMHMQQGDKGDTIKASYLHHLDQHKKSATIAEFSRRFSTNENTFTVGGLYAIDHLTLVKAKLNNHGSSGRSCSMRSFRNLCLLLRVNLTHWLWTKLQGSA
ncbi:hypothetical protein Cgig2_010876 [Carnegiea gigantea]|uniref:Uncharacterized protein n=1 Tax=Carnegiea gigantea TaxID=171969 RepID=A0A9Q1GYS9_9CARY|nr:hypothetical protein Cgig2_010876 [Carnegiea gigantea]